MRTLKKALSCLLVLNLLLGGGLVFAPKADALEALLFPFITTEVGKFTFITINNDGAGAPFGVPPSALIGNLHFTYATKPVPVLQRTGCLHFNADAFTTDVDMMIFEVNKKVSGPGGAAALFEPSTGQPITSVPITLPSVDRVGFLIVEPTSPINAYLFGTAAVVDAATGLAFSYSTNWFTATGAAGGVNPPFTAIDGGLYAGGAPVGPGGVGFSGFKNVAWYPTSIVSTSWYVLPLSTRSVMSPGAGGGIRLGLRTATDHLPAPNLEGAYDLDERFFSGGLRKNVRCLAIITRANFLGTDVDISTAGGGFTFLAANGSSATVGPTDAQDPGGVYGPTPFMLLKIQSTHALGAQKSTMHQEADHNPCFNPNGTFGPGICAGH